MQNGSENQQTENAKRSGNIIERSRPTSHRINNDDDDKEKGKQGRQGERGIQAQCCRVDDKSEGFAEVTLRDGKGENSEIGSGDAIGGDDDREEATGRARPHHLTFFFFLALPHPIRSGPSPERRRRRRRQHKSLASAPPEPSFREGSTPPPTRRRLSSPPLRFPPPLGGLPLPVLPLLLPLPLTTPGKPSTRGSAPSASGGTRRC